MTNAFGIVAMVAMAPLIVIQFMGLMYGNKMKTYEAQSAQEIAEMGSEDPGAIVEFPDDWLHAYS